MVEDLARYWRGWLGYLKCETPSVLDAWKNGPEAVAVGDLEAMETGRRRYAELRRRGVKQLAAKAAGSAHGPWRLANSGSGPTERLFHRAGTAEPPLKLLKGQYVQGGAEKSAPPFFLCLTPGVTM